MEPGCDKTQAADTAEKLLLLNLIVNSNSASDVTRSLALSLAFEYGKIEGRRLATEKIERSLKVVA